MKSDDIVLSDGQPVGVRRLSFLELEDKVSCPDPGLHIHTYMVDGHPQQVAYGLNDYTEIPDRPKTPFAEAKPDSYEAAVWEQYNLYRAVLTNEQKRAEIEDQYLVDCACYILDNCIDLSDRDRIVTPGDFDIIYRRALCPEVTGEDIIACLANTFQGNMEGAAFVDLAGEAEGIGRILFTDTVVGTQIDVDARVE